MPSTHSSLHYHVVFSTKGRVPRIADRWRTELHDYLGGCVRGLEAVSLRVGGVADHVHLLIGAKPSHSPAQLVREIKKASTSWIRSKHDPAFAWQVGYGVFSVSRGVLPAVSAYIDHQEEHHRTRTFQEEYVAFLEELGIDYDPRYIW